MWRTAGGGRSSVLYVALGDVTRPYADASVACRTARCVLPETSGPPRNSPIWARPWPAAPCVPYEPPRGRSCEARRATWMTDQSIRERSTQLSVPGPGLVTALAQSATVPRRCPGSIFTTPSSWLDIPHGHPHIPLLAPALLVGTLTRGRSKQRGIQLILVQNVYMGGIDKYKSSKDMT